MAFDTISKKYLRELRREYDSAVSGGAHTAELSYRPVLHSFIKDIVREFGIASNTEVILEPNTQGHNGRPDWRIHDKNTLGIYGYIEAKGIGPNPLDSSEYQSQIDRYLDLGHKLVFTDGVDFFFYTPERRSPQCVSLFDKNLFNRRDWSSLPLAPQIEVLFRDFLSAPAPQQCSEDKLISLVAKRTRILADKICYYSMMNLSEAIDSNERSEIALLSQIKTLVFNHNDPRFHTEKAFSDFTSQVIMFCLLYAHRVLCLDSDSAIVKEQKIKNYIYNSLPAEEVLAPFKSLMDFVLTNTPHESFIAEWVDECIKFLSFVQMTGNASSSPDFHKLFERFLSEYDHRSRFDYGAYYTPKILADYVVKLTERVVSEVFPGTSIFDDDNTIIDPCCGTGSFLESIINHDPRDGGYSLCGFEILPAPYMLANYRLSLIRHRQGSRRLVSKVVLANTLSNCVLGESANLASIEGAELAKANDLSSLPLKVIIGNPPCSDSLRENTSREYSRINALMEDFRMPATSRRARQNTQKQVFNPFMQFLRWGCEKLLHSETNAALSFIVPSSFLEAESYKYARRFIAQNFSNAWIVCIDSDARTGVRSGSLFHTLQGRALIVLTRKYGQQNSITEFSYADYSQDVANKLSMLTASADDTMLHFHTCHLDATNCAFTPSKEFDAVMYRKFWPVSGEADNPGIFIKHCSGTKLSPTAMFSHVKRNILKRRSKDISISGYRGTMAWFSGQDKKPKQEQVDAFKNALNAIGSTSQIDSLLDRNIHTYSFRPFLQSNALIWEDLLRRYARIGGGGTRPRPELIKAYNNNRTIGFAMAHAPKDLNPTLTQFVSFCWYYPDNDMCTRGNSHIYMNQYPGDDANPFQENINPSLLVSLGSMLGKQGLSLLNDIVFYCYGVLCSQVFLDEFEGALFTVNQSDNRARIPVVGDKTAFNRIVSFGKKLANLEKEDYTPSNRLLFDYSQLCDSIPTSFHLKREVYPFDEDKEILNLTDGNSTIGITCPLSLQRLNISGYNVVKDVWLKFNSYDFTHCDFTRDDMKNLLDFLNKLVEREDIVSELDGIVRQVLNGQYPLIIS